MKTVNNRILWTVMMLAVVGTSRGANAQVVAPPQVANQGLASQWESAGWGGGGYYWATAFHPRKDGVIYMAGDVLGVYKTADHGRSWRIINNGLGNYAVYSLAVDRANPDTVYAASEGGLYKSSDTGEHWTLLPHTGREELRITGERGKSVRCIAVDPTNGNIVYAASPSGLIYKSIDGGQNWATVYGEKDSSGALRVQYGKNNGDYFGGLWLPLTVPAGLQTADAVGLGFAFQGDGTAPREAYLSLTTVSGALYRSKNLSAFFLDKVWRDVLLRGEDFAIDPEYAKQHPDAVKTLPATPEWGAVNRMDFACVGDLPNASSVIKLGRIFFGVTRTPDGKTANADKPILLTAREFSVDKTVRSYGNISVGAWESASISSVALAPKNSATVLAVSQGTGLLLSRDAGTTWTALKAPAKASAAAFDAVNADVIYAGFDNGGIGKSTDGGVTWTTATEGFAKDLTFKELVVSPTNSQDVYAIGAAGWGGFFYASHDGGKNWANASTLATDPKADPTLPGEGATATLSAVTNLAINPVNPQELFISANWRPCLSQDAGRTWTERVHGADISVITDVRFSEGRVYASAMDEGTLMSENDGGQWQQLWPLKWSQELSGHNWRLAITRQNGADRIISTVSPWDKYPPRTVLSEDGGKNFKIVTAGLPDYLIHPNTMWGVGHPRALAVDPRNPQIAYVGIDGDATDGKSGGGLFKSLDGGASWKQLPNQPGSRRMFYGLMVDPTDSQRIYWAALGDGGGVWRSENGGESWQHVFSDEGWPFNLMVARDGTAYCAGRALWRSSDHGATWKKLTNFSPGGNIMGLEEDPRDSKTLWISFDAGKGGVYKTGDGGATWKEMTGNLPYIYPQVLRFNPATNELWAGGVGLFKIKQ
ncbi:hypothetical protein IAD21_00516 [Abditibacteriota bacterium]|nr:hypothetical protein IAD21_00516 [Abditibacteriota bacterium]